MKAGGEDPAGLCRSEPRRNGAIRSITCRERRLALERKRFVRVQLHVRPHVAPRGDEGFELDLAGARGSGQDEAKAV